MKKCYISLDFCNSASLPEHVASLWYITLFKHKTSRRRSGCSTRLREISAKKKKKSHCLCICHSLSSRSRVPTIWFLFEIMEDYLVSFLDISESFWDSSSKVLCTSERLSHILLFSLSACSSFGETSL